jgi:hypothetical protein
MQQPKKAAKSAQDEQRGGGSPYDSFEKIAWATIWVDACCFRLKLHEFF